MTQTTTTNRWSYTGDASTTTFAYTNKIFATTDLKVYLDGTLQASGYSVTGAGNANGGNVVFSSAPGSDVVVVIVRDVPYTQETDLIDAGPAPMQTIEQMADRATIQIQQINDQIARTLRQPEGDTTAIGRLPAKASRLGKLLQFNSTTGDPEVVSATDANLVTVSPFVGTLLDDTTSNAFLTTLTATRSEDNAVAVPVLTKLRERVSVTDFGAVGDGTTDDTDAFNAALATGKNVYVPPGEYEIEGQLQAGQFDGQRLFADGGAYGAIVNLSYAAGDYQVLVGDLATRTNDIVFENIRFTQDDAATNTMFQMRNVRGLRFKGCTIRNVHKFMMLGDATAASAAYIFGLHDCEAACRAGHSHFITVANYDGQFEFLGASVVEGNYETSTSFFHCESNASTRVDHMMIYGGYIGRFNRGFNFSNTRVVNFELIGTRLDEFSQYAGAFFTTSSGGGVGGAEGVRISGVTLGVGVLTSANGFYFSAKDSSEFSDIHLADIIAVSAGRPVVEMETDGVGEITNVSLSDISVAKLSLNGGLGGSGVVLNGAGINHVRINGLDVHGDPADMPERALLLASGTTGQNIQASDITGENFTAAVVTDTVAATGATRNIPHTDGTPKSRFWVGPFTLSDVAASQTNVATMIVTANSTPTLGVAGQMPMPRRGRVSAISVATSPARSAGSLTAKCAVNGTAGTLQAVIDGTNTQFVTATQTTGDAFSAGDRLSVRITTDASWSPTPDVAVWLEITET